MCFWEDWAYDLRNLSMQPIRGQPPQLWSMLKVCHAYTFYVDSAELTQLTLTNLTLTLTKFDQGVFWTVFEN